jgi:hypothetical protein
LYNQQLPAAPKQLKHIVIPAPTDCVRLLLSRDDLGDLHTMLEQADNEIKACQLLELFST